MDIALLAKDAVTLLAPALPYLVTAGNKAVEEVGKKIGGDALDYAKTLWAKLRPKAEAKPALLEAIKDAAAAPKDEDAQAQLRVQLKKLLKDDARFASELESILGEAKKANIASGERAVVLDNSDNNIVITGDQKYER